MLFNYSRTSVQLNLIVLFIGVGAGKCLGVRRIIAQISPNLLVKNSKENDLQKNNINDCISFHVRRIFFK